MPTWPSVSRRASAPGMVSPLLEPQTSPSTPNSPESIEDTKDNASQVDWRRRPMDLPDLTDKMIEAGVYEHYIKYRDGYMKWRQGEGKGAKGEVTATEEAIDTKQNFTYWYPTYATFKFRRTVAYWIAVSTYEGAVFWTLTSFFGLYPFQKLQAGRAYIALKSAPELFGSLCFLVGTYLGVFELVNLPLQGKEGETSPALWIFNVRSLSEHATWRAIFGYYVYFFGALCYTFALSLSLLYSCFGPSVFKQDWLFLETVIIFVGGCCFALGGLMQVLINQVWRLRPSASVWWVSLFNFLGGACYFFAGASPLVWSRRWRTKEIQLDAIRMESFTSFIGSICYIISAQGLLLMWRGEKFGGGLLNQLNDLSRPNRAISGDSGRGDSAAPDESSTGISVDGSANSMNNVPEGSTMSWRGVFFHFVYVVSACSAIYNCAVSIEQVKVAPVLSFVLALHWFNTYMLVHLILVLHSAGVKLPKQQPYRLLMVATRFVMVLAMMDSIAYFLFNLRMVYLFEFHRIWDGT